MTNNVKDYVHGADLCPVCNSNYGNLRSIEVMVRVHKEAQFPITFTDPETGHSLAELPSCEATDNLFKANEKKKKIVVLVLDNEA